jgi:TPR repeat protein
VPVKDFAEANEELASLSTECYYSCCGKSICGGCVHSFIHSGNTRLCPHCKREQEKTVEERVEEIMKRVEANDAGSMYVLGSHYYQGELGLPQDREKAKELWTRAADLGYSKAHFRLGINIYEEVGSKKAKFHLEAAAMAGDEEARCNLAGMEAIAGNYERALKHWTIAAAGGEYMAMQNVLNFFKKGYVSRQSIKSSLKAYNDSCAEMRSEARDAYIRRCMDNIGAG